MRKNFTRLNLAESFTRFAAVALWLCLGGVLAVLGASSFRGLEGTDEASYLLTASNPWASPGNGIFSGYFLHPLWLMTGHVGSFRIGGLVGILLGALIFSMALVRAGASLGTGDTLRQCRVILIPSIALAVLARYSVGIRTPGYDWALLLCALLLAAAWLWMESRPGQPAHVGWVGVMALGGLGIFMAKWMVLPGYLLLFGALAMQRFFGADRKRLGWMLVAWTGVVVSLFVLYVSPRGTTDTVHAALAQLKTGSHDGILRHYGIGFLKGSWQVLRALPWLVILYGLVWGVFRIFGHNRPDPSHVAGVSFLAGLGLAMARGYWLGGQTTFSKGMMVVLVWLTGVYFMCRPYRTGETFIRAEGSQVQRRTLTMLMLLPLLNGAGTATGITDYLGHAVVFFLATGWILLGQAVVRGLPVWCLAAAFLCIGVIQAARGATTTLNTYRVGSVWVKNLVPIPVGPEEGRLWTYPLAADSLKKILSEMRRWGFREGEPIVGITDCPGLVYLLGGVSPGACWYISYYLPKNFGVKMNLANIAKETLARSWFLVRESARENEKLENVWPEEKGVPYPIPLAGDFFWPWGDAEGKAERIFIYRPATRVP